MAANNAQSSSFVLLINVSRSMGREDKLPNSDTCTPMPLDIFDEDATFSQASDFIIFTASIAFFSMLLTGSDFKESSSYTDILNWLSTANLSDNYDFKAALKTIVSMASAL